MSGPIQITSDKINADVAGLTSAAPEPPTAQGTTVAEQIRDWLPTSSGGLEGLLGEASHFPELVSTAVEGEAGKLGPNGGRLLPSLGPLSPGPGVGQSPQVATVKADIVSGWSKVRSWLGF